MKFEWIDGFVIAVNITNDQVVVKANSEGLLSLANYLKTLANSKVEGAHIHLDEFNCLEEGSKELIIEKIN